MYVMKITYRISSNRRRISLFAARSCAAIPFEGGVYFLENPADINDGWIRYVTLAGCLRNQAVYTKILLTFHQHCGPRQIALYYSVKNIRNKVRQIIYEK